MKEILCSTCNYPVQVDQAWVEWRADYSRRTVKAIKDSLRIVHKNGDAYNYGCQFNDKAGSGLCDCYLSDFLTDSGLEDIYKMLEDGYMSLKDGLKLLRAIAQAKERGY